MIQRPLLLWLLCASLSWLSACSDKTEEMATEQARPVETEALAKANTQRPERSDEEQELDVLTNKLGGYINCYNPLNPSAARTIGRYASWVKNMDTGPTGKERLVYGLYDLDAEKALECKDQFAALASTKPELEQLDDAGKRYIEAVTDMTKVVNTAYTYYDRENYKDDGFAKGQALHAELKTAFAAFSETSARFSGELDKTNTALQLDRLKLIEKQLGKTLPYWTALQSIRAKQLVDLLMEEHFSLDEANKAFSEFEEAVDARSAQLSKGGNGNRDITSQIPSTAEDLRKSAKELIRRVRDNTPYRDTDIGLMRGSTGWMVNGSPPRVLHDYNNFVDASNRYQ